MLLALALAGWLPPHPAAELARFPPREAVLAARRFNREYAAHLRHRLALQPHYAEVIRAALGETEALYRIWDALDDAQIMQSAECRWAALSQLRELLGEPAYTLGRMPPPVPLGRFQEID